MADTPSGEQRELDAARESFERRFQVGPDGNSATAPTGEKYVAICSGGEKEEGKTFPCYCTSPTIAIELCAYAANKYAASVSGNVLYWRERPMLETVIFRKPVIIPQLPAEEMRIWIVYSRMLIGEASK